MKAFVEARVSEGEYQDAGEYILALIQDDQRRKAEAHLDSLLQEGLNSGDPIEANARYWEKKRHAFLERLPRSENL